MDLLDWVLRERACYEGSLLGIWPKLCDIKRKREGWGEGRVRGLGKRSRRSSCGRSRDWWEAFSLFWDFLSGEEPTSLLKFFVLI